MSEYLDWEGWVTTYARCNACGYTWVTVTPAWDITTKLECPHCTREGEKTT